MSEFDELIRIVEKLRVECPWDKEQTHESLAKHLIEESYELLDACLLYTSPSPRDRTRSRMPSSA